MLTWRVQFERTVQNFYSLFALAVSTIDGYLLSKLVILLPFEGRLCQVLD